jgi:GNAT superfamily N-acetyltransferase
MSSSPVQPQKAKPTAGPLVLLEHHQVNEAASLAAAAFISSPSYSYIYEGLTPAKKLEALTYLFEVNIRIRVETCGGAWCAFEEDQEASSSKPSQMLCFFMLQSPGTEDIGSWTMIKNGILLFPFRFGYRAFQRLLEVKDYHEKIEAQAVVTHGSGGATKGFAQLERMVVHPKAQGCGIGGRSLKAALNKASEAGDSVLLETQLEINVSFYEKLGFEVIGKDEQYFKIDGSKGVTNWTMVKRSDA